MTLLPTAAAMAQPQMSTDNDTHWYLITFNNGGRKRTIQRFQRLYSD
jgi:hypothetical protein